MDKIYVVIGGQYKQCYYGMARTLRGAKRIASQNCEYWDNWQGWTVPKIYAIEDCEEKDGRYFHKYGAYPVSTGAWTGNRVKWEDSYTIPF